MLLRIRIASIYAVVPLSWGLKFTQIILGLKNYVNKSY